MPTPDLKSLPAWTVHTPVGSGGTGQLTGAGASSLADSRVPRLQAGLSGHATDNPDKGNCPKECETLPALKLAGLQHPCPRVSGTMRSQRQKRCFHLKNFCSGRGEGGDELSVIATVYRMLTPCSARCFYEQFSSPLPSQPSLVGATLIPCLWFGKRRVR